MAAASHPLGPARTPLLTGQALRADALEIAGRIADSHRRCGCLAHMSNGRIERGVGRVPIERVPYPVDLALEVLRDIDVLILVGAKVPVAFFAYPGKPGRLVRDDCEVIELARAGRGPQGRARLACRRARRAGRQPRATWSRPLPRPTRCRRGG